MCLTMLSPHFSVRNVCSLDTQVTFYRVITHYFKAPLQIWKSHPLGRSMAFSTVYSKSSNLNVLQNGERWLEIWYVIPSAFLLFADFGQQLYSKGV